MGTQSIEILVNNLRILVIYLSFLTQLLVSECPHLCECKWKSGKESVICLNANLSSIPQHLDGGTQILDLTGNNLVSVKHDEFKNAGLPNLQKVYISKCRLKNLERRAFKSLINLVELDLSYNVLTSIPFHTFDSIPELRELKLSGNPITRIPNKAFSHLNQLVKLELSDCKIHTIENEAFNGLEQSLEWLKLDNNKLQDVLPSSVTILENLHGLELANNPWNCSCTLRPLHQWMLRKNIPFGIPPTCNLPPRLKSKQWHKLHVDEFACAPEILAVDSRAYGVEGKNVTMKCRIGGIPEPTVRWILKNKVIANLSGTPYSNGKKLYVVHLTNRSSYLTILTADAQDAGVYVCTAENKAGRAEATVTLAVSRQPTQTGLSDKAFLVTVITGALLVTLTCLITAFFYNVRRKRALQWQKRKCAREENYEKIELNHKVPGSSSTLVVQQEVVVDNDRRHGDYRLIPGADNEQAEKENTTQTVTTPVANGNNNEGQLISTWNKNGNVPITDTKWESSELSPFENEDTNNSRNETNRDDRSKSCNSMSGTYNYYLDDQKSGHVSSNTSSFHFMRKQPYDSLSFGSSENHQHYEKEEDRKKYQANDSKSHGRSNFDYPSSATSDVYCTLPRKISDVYRKKYSYPATSTDSQSPLLPGSTSSRESGDGGCCLSEENYSLRRFSDPYKKITHFKSNSYVNLVNVNIENSNTSSFPPLSYLDQNGLTATSPSTLSLYDYHANQLKKFLEEYRTLQKELTRMKESCDNIGKNCSLVYTTRITNSNNENDNEDEDNCNNSYNVDVVVPSTNYSTVDSCDNMEVRNS